MADEEPGLRRARAQTVGLPLRQRLRRIRRSGTAHLRRPRWPVRAGRHQLRRRRVAPDLPDADNGGRARPPDARRSRRDASAHRRPARTGGDVVISLAALALLPSMFVAVVWAAIDRKRTRLNSGHVEISYA